MNAKDHEALARVARTLAEAEAVKTRRPVEVSVRTVTPAEPLLDTWSSPTKGV